MISDTAHAYQQGFVAGQKDGRAEYRKELINKVKELENYWEYTPKDDMFGTGWNKLKVEVLALLQEEK